MAIGQVRWNHLVVLLYFINIKNYFDSDGIINLTDDFNFESLNYELYYSKLSAIKNNFNKIKKYEILEDMFYYTLKQKNII